MRWTAEQMIRAGAKIEHKLYRFALLQLGNERAASDCLCDAFKALCRHGNLSESNFEHAAFHALWRACSECAVQYDPNALPDPAIGLLLQSMDARQRAVRILVLVCKKLKADALAIVV